MATGRFIARSIVDSERQLLLSCDAARLLYRDMLVHLDINGCFNGNPTIIKSKIFPLYDDAGHSVEAVRKYIEEMASPEIALIEIYEVEKKKYIYYPNFIIKQPGLVRDRESPEYPTNEKVEENNAKQWALKQERYAKQKDSFKKQHETAGPTIDMPAEVRELKEYYEKTFRVKLSLNKFLIDDFGRIIKDFTLETTKKMAWRMKQDYGPEHQGAANFIKYANDLFELVSK